MRENACSSRAYFIDISALNYSRWELSHRYQKGKSARVKKSPCGNKSHKFPNAADLSVYPR
jgi:hypothetical protein